MRTSHPPDQPNGHPRPLARRLPASARRLLLAAVALAALHPGGALAAPGSFSASDPLLGTVWEQSAKTAGLMLSAPTDLGAGCSYPAGHTAILDGYVRDRCAWIGDLAVTGKTLLLTGQGDPSDLRFELQQFADSQRADGSICPVIGPECAGRTLVDYEAYWIETLRDYVLYTGDVGAARAMLGTVSGILDRYYAANTVDGLFRNSPGSPDYAFINRHSPTVAYYNALYAVALRDGVQLARWAGADRQAAAWGSRAGSLAQSILSTFWDASAGAFKGTPDAGIVHPQDGNVFAVLAGAGSAAQRRSALVYLGTHNGYEHGNSIADTNVWDGFPWGQESERRAYPFISFFAVLARFQEGLDRSAIDLIRREWGFMAKNGPGTTWEVIGPDGSPNVSGAPSLAHGWSSGAAPALTSYVLGVQPDGPGFARFVARPHTARLTWAAGDVPTPSGTIHFEWRRQGKRFTAEVDSPVSGTVVLPAVGVTTVDGARVPRAKARMTTTVRVDPGRHSILVAPPGRVSS